MSNPITTLLYVSFALGIIVGGLWTLFGMMIREELRRRGFYKRGGNK